jgi:hypothetical protein
MNNLIVLTIIIVASLVLGLIKYGSLADQYKGEPWQSKFNEIWNDFVNFLIAGLVGYFFVLVRLPLLLKGESLTLSDFGLLVVFILGLFGHLCVMSKNITDGITAIFKRVLER